MWRFRPFLLSQQPLRGECWLIVLRVLMTPQPSTSPHIYTYIVCYKASTSALCGLRWSTDNSQFSFFLPVSSLSLAQPDYVLVQLVWEGLEGEFILYPLSPSLSHVPAELRLPHQPLHSLGEGLRRGLAQEARLPICHAFQGPPGVHRDNRAAAVHGLHGNYPEVLSARGVQHGCAASKQRHLQRVRGWAQESDAVPQAELRCELFHFGEVLNVFGDSVVVAPHHHEVNARSLARREAVPQGSQRLQSQPQVLLPLVSVQREKQAGGSFGEQPVQALRLRGRLVKGARVEGRVEDVRLDSWQTAKGLPKDACCKLAVYQNLWGSTKLVHKDLTRRISQAF